MTELVAVVPKVRALPRKHPRHWGRILGLSAGLLLLQGLVGGFFYETNDDQLMELLVRGIAAAAPVADLHLYLYGWGHLLVALYGAAPAIPWYGLLLYGLLYVALAVSFWTLETVNYGRLGARHMVAAEVGFYALTYALHAWQINFTRPAVLLGAAAGLVLLLPRPAGSRVGRVAWLAAGLLLVAGWGLRPSGAGLGVGLTLPLALWQGWGPGARKAGLLAGLLLALIGLRLATDTAVDRDYRSSDLDRSRLFDVNTQHRFEICTSSDSLAYKLMVPYQGINDSVLLNPAFFRRTVHPVNQQLIDWSSYRRSFVVALGSLVLRMSGCLLLVALGGAVVGRAMRAGELRAWHWPVLAFVAYQGLFAGLFLVLVPHLPLRVLQPIVTVYLLVNIVLVAGCLLPAVALPVRGRRTLKLAGAALGLVWLAVNARLWQQLRTDSQAHEAYLTRLEVEAGPGVLVEQGLYATYAHLNPLAPHHLEHYQKILMLSGWLAFDPSQPALRQALTGSRDMATCLWQLGQRPGTAWVLQPDFAPVLARYLNERLGLQPAQQVWFEPVAGSQLPRPASNPPRLFRLRPVAGHHP